MREVVTIKKVGKAGYHKGAGPVFRLRRLHALFAQLISYV